jgi:hypothetical protein
VPLRHRLSSRVSEEPFGHDNVACIGYRYAHLRM